MTPLTTAPPRVARLLIVSLYALPLLSALTVALTPLDPEQHYLPSVASGLCGLLLYAVAVLCGSVAVRRVHPAGERVVAVPAAKSARPAAPRPGAKTFSKPVARLAAGAAANAPTAFGAAATRAELEVETVTEASALTPVPPSPALWSHADWLVVSAVWMLAALLSGGVLFLVAAEVAYEMPSGANQDFVRSGARALAFVTVAACHGLLMWRAARGGAWFARGERVPCPVRAA